MKKIILALINILIASLLVSKSMADIIYLTQDTTVSGTWNLNGEVLYANGGIVTGGGTITNGIIDGNAYQQMFDTSMKFTNCKAREWSVIWMGAKTSLADNYYPIQRSFDQAVANNIVNIYIPFGSYSYSLPLKIQKISNNLWQDVAQNVYGDGGFWTDGTVLNYTATTGFAFSFQRAKGGSLHNIKIQGQWVPPLKTDYTYYSITEANYNDRNGVCATDYRGLVIDWDGSRNTGGSTGLYIHDCYITGFDKLIVISLDGRSQNADNLTFERIQFGNGRIGFLSNQPQEKGNVLRDIACWGSLHTLISIGNGNLGAGNYNIDGVKVAGSVVRLFNINQKGWFKSSISHVYAESFGSVGTILTGDNTYSVPITISHCIFDFATQPEAGKQTVLTTSKYQIKFEDCDFRYYGRPQDTLNFSGVATFVNCNFAAKTNGLANSEIINYPTPALPKIIEPTIIVRKSAN